MCKFAQHPQDMRLTYVLGTSIYFNKSANSRGYLDYGWGETESGGVWTTDSEAQLMLNFQSKPSSSLSLNIFLTPFIYNAANQGVSIYINGNHLDVWDFSDTNGGFPILLEYFMPIEMVNSKDFNCST